MASRHSLERAARERAGAAPPEAAEAAAIDWLVALHSGRASAGDWQAFAAWRARDPANERAAAAAERLWAQLGEAGRPLLAATASAAGRPTRRRALQIGIATGVTAQLDARTGLQGDGAGVELLGGRALFATTAQSALAVRAAGHALRLPGGAEVEIDLRAPELRVAVLAGALDLLPHDLPARRIAARAGVLLPATGGLAPLGALDRAGAGAWRRGQLVYHDQELRAVLADLERYRGGRIVALDDGLAAARVTGVFALGDPDAALDAIGATLGLTVTRWPLLAVVRPA